MSETNNFPTPEQPTASPALVDAFALRDHRQAMKQLPLAPYTPRPEQLPATPQAPEITLPEPTHRESRALGGGLRPAETVLPDFSQEKQRSWRHIGQKVLQRFGIQR